jgi:hypothetical protein
VFDPLCKYHTKYTTLTVPTGPFKMCTPGAELHELEQRYLSWSGVLENIPVSSAPQGRTRPQNFAHISVTHWSGVQLCKCAFKIDFY